MFFNHPLRTAAGRVKIDREEGLYLADAPRTGFISVRRGAYFSLTPDTALIGEFVRWVDARGTDFFSRSLGNLEGGWAEDLPLLLESVKRMENGGPENALLACERRIRQRAAVCLREKHGGGLLKTCAACLRIGREGLTKP